MIRPQCHRSLLLVGVGALGVIALASRPAPTQTAIPDEALPSPTAASSVVEPAFLRGDIDEDGGVSVRDAYLILGGLFSAPPAQLHCLDAADADDDGRLGITDVVSVLALIYRQAGPLVGEVSCQRDESGDALDCLVYDACP